MNRFAEPSTWAGIAALFQVLKAFLPAHNQPYADALTAAAASIAVKLPERAQVG
jgi:hypothetical protein